MSVRRAPRSGFTIIELMIVFVTVGILVGIALPSLTGAIARADAVKVVADVRTVRLAVLELEAVTGSLPAPGGWGEVPAELQSLLPDGFVFGYKELEYAWSTLAQGAPGSASVPEPVERWLGHSMARPGAGVQGQGKGQGEGGSGGSGGAGSSGSGSGSETSGTGDSDAVGVLWVRYAATDPVAGALQSHASSTAVWSPTQMTFLVTR